MSVIMYIKSIKVKEEEIRMKKHTHTGTIDVVISMFFLQKLKIGLFKEIPENVEKRFMLPGKK